ncbi:uncharacterized protein L969DRAFT_44640 [Mixia osmundae IAM 14324]|uniref:ornithine decarboxylase n=1 Tax=Mixia osmundae (strain CBS 9802 / IAM 14324 / JCM 22182 / KY 12970) TaxID=764103 RepID=G7DXW3_MIXOS|nr:uncharacterized protein L969DRAFT_44640 [Mixia osmundae IAM 14324]KEI41326.1 hypothetical protein L969DRAFT_44640 [Mixia osmundae IAM 14324]GAA95423.1 hypothetical protein E5Q_02077 [Mixia osmundae IAM 14324]
MSSTLIFVSPDDGRSSTPRHGPINSSRGSGAGAANGPRKPGFLLNPAELTAGGSSGSRSNSSTSLNDRRPTRSDSERREERRRRRRAQRAASAGQEEPESPSSETPLSSSDGSASHRVYNTEQPDLAWAEYLTAYRAGSFPADSTPRQPSLLARLDEEEGADMSQSDWESYTSSRHASIDAGPPLNAQMLQSRNNSASTASTAVARTALAALSLHSRKPSLPAPSEDDTGIFVQDAAYAQNDQTNTAEYAHRSVSLHSPTSSITGHLSDSDEGAGMQVYETSDMKQKAEEILSFYKKNRYLPAPDSQSKNTRLKLLHRYGLLDPNRRAAVAKIAQVAQLVFNAAAVIVTLLEDSQQTFVASIGFSQPAGSSLPTRDSFCPHSLLTDEPLVVLRPEEDWRFANNPNVKSGHIAQYIGAPISMATTSALEMGVQAADPADGDQRINVGSLCLLESDKSRRRTSFSAEDKRLLTSLADMIARELSTSHMTAQIEAQALQREFLGDLLASTVCRPSQATSASDGAANAPVDVFERTVEGLRQYLPVDFAAIVDVRNYHAALSSLNDTKWASADAHSGAPSRQSRTWTSQNVTGVFKTLQTASGPTISWLEAEVNSKEAAVTIMASSTDSRHNDWIAQISSARHNEDYAECLLAFLEHSHVRFEAKDFIPGLRRLLPAHAQAAMMIPLFAGDELQPQIMVLAASCTPHTEYTSAEADFVSGLGAICLGQMQRRQIVAASKSQTLFVSQISHELRTPLHAILLELEGMRDALDSEDYYEQILPMLNTAAVCGENLRSVLEDVLDFSKVEAVGATPVHAHRKRALTEVDLSEELINAVKSCRARKLRADAIDDRSTGDRVSIIVETEAKHGSWHALVDKAGLNRIILNVTGNSLKYTEHGSVNVSLRVLRDPPGSQSPDVQQTATSLIEIRVTDTGCGFSSSFAKNDLFTPFKQGNEFSTGVGLGLSIVRAIVKRMVGDILVDSVEGQGTTMTIILPVQWMASSDDSAVLTPPKRVCLTTYGTPVPSATSTEGSLGRVLARESVRASSSHKAAKPPVSRDSSASTAHSGSKRFRDGRSADIRVLIAEDNAISRKILTTMLARKGIDYRAACDGQEAIDIYAQYHPTVCWLDVNMPRKSGLEAATEIRQIEQKHSLRRSNIVIISGGSSEQASSMLATGQIDSYNVKGGLSLKALVGALESQDNDSSAPEAANATRDLLLRLAIAGAGDCLNLGVDPSSRQLQSEKTYDCQYYRPRSSTLFAFVLVREAARLCVVDHTSVDPQGSPRTIDLARGSEASAAESVVTTSRPAPAQGVGRIVFASPLQGRSTPPCSQSDVHILDVSIEHSSAPGTPERRLSFAPESNKALRSCSLPPIKRGFPRAPPPPVFETPEIFTGSILEVMHNTVAEHEDHDGHASVEDAFFVCDLAQVYKQIVRWWDQFGHPLHASAEHRIEPFFAVKSNPDPLVLKMMAALGFGFDCASHTEIALVLALGVHPDQIIYANPCKAASMVGHAASHRVNHMTFDNADELRKVSRLHPDARMVLRILTDDSGSLCRLGLKFGAAMSEVRPLLTRAKELGVEVVGISFHVGSGCSNPLLYDDAIHRAKLAFQIGAELGYDFTLLDIGGGFGSDNLELMAAVIHRSLTVHFPDRRKVRVIAEPGRYYVAEAFQLATNIIARRGLSDEQERAAILCEAANTTDEPAVMYYINDGVYGSFNCTMFDHQVVHPRVLTAKGAVVDDGKQFGKVQPCSIWGPTCDSIDVVQSKAFLPTDSLVVGDWLRWENMGAYTICAASQFNGMARSEVSYTIDAGGDDTLEAKLRALVLS